MEKEPKRLVLRATPVIIVLSLLLVYSDFYRSSFLRFDIWKDQYTSAKDCLTSKRVNEKADQQESQVTRREDGETSDEHESSLSSGVVNNKAEEEPEAHLTSRKVDKTVDRDEFQLTSREDGETSDEQESRLNSRAVNSTDEEPDSQVTSRKDSKTSDEREPELSSRVVNKAIDGPESQLTSTEDGKTSAEHESELSSRVVNKALEEPESQDSSREANTTVDEKAFQLLTREVNKTADEHEVGLSSREENKTDDEKAFQPLIGEVNNTVDQHKPTKSLLARLVRGEDRTKLETTGFACDRARFSVVCVADKPVRIDTNTMTVYVPTDQTAEPKKTEVRPYARQDDIDLLQRITPVQILQGNPTPPTCKYTHNVPAVIFSSSGFAGNLFHEFNEIIIPLFLTTLHLRSRALFIAIDYKPSFLNKYSKVMSRLSSYEIMNPTADRSVHCFSGAVVGLKYHDNLALNSSDIPGGYSMPDFRQFLRKTYNLKIKNVSEIGKPVLMLMSRLGTRRFLNEGEMVTMMKKLGFKVIVVRKPDRMSNLNKFTRVVNKCSVLVGAHGAGLANELFLPTGGVMVQVDPLGLEWGSAYFYGNPAAAMGVHYLRYKIEPEESSLLAKYGRNHPVIADPASIFAQGYQTTRAFYLDQQNIKVNVTRFRETLTEALRLLGHSAPSQ